MRLAIWGSGGFIGKALIGSAEAAGLNAIALPRLDLSEPAAMDAAIELEVESWLQSHPEEIAQTTQLLTGVDVVINAAGLAEPGGSDISALMTANALLPGVMSALCARSGVGRMVHVSSAAVQGRRDPLDETEAVEPFSPYSASKAAGEALLLGRAVDSPDEVVLYRPTSVQAEDRAITRSLVALASRKLVPYPAPGDAPLPVCLLQNVAAGILHAAAMELNDERIILQPSEEMTTKSLLRAFGPSSTLMPVPAGAVKLVHRMARRWAGRRPGLEPRLRRFELLAFGQGIQATNLKAAGFTPAAGPDGYVRLGDAVRSRSVRADSAPGAAVMQ